MAAARQALASMLDELMGRHRNALPSEKPKETTFDDPEVCKYFLAGYCHHELFTNTKADLGPCGKLHDEKLRSDYRASEKFEKLGYDDEWLAALQRIHNDIQRRIGRNKQRLELTQPGGKVEDSNQEKVSGKIDSLSEKITALLQQAETLGCQGRVDEAKQLIDKMEEMTEDRDRCKKTVESPIGELKTMEVCDTCGCFLIIGDSQHRIDEHLTGKQHLGFAKIKATIEELMRKRDEKRRLCSEESKNQLDGREKRWRESEEHRHDRYQRHRSRSRSPHWDAGHSRNRNVQQNFHGERQRRYYGRGQKYHWQSNYRRTSGNDYDNGSRHQVSSHYSLHHERQGSAYSPKHRHGRPYTDSSRSRISESNARCNGESSFQDHSSSSTSSADHNMNALAKGITKSASRHTSKGPAHLDDDDDEGLISSDE